MQQGSLRERYFAYARWMLLRKKPFTKADLGTEFDLDENSTCRIVRSAIESKFLRECQQPENSRPKLYEVA